MPSGGQDKIEEVPLNLYWGGPDGFRPRRRTALINDSAADGLAADFNRDGLLDLAVVNHTVDDPVESVNYPFLSCYPVKTTVIFKC